MIMIDAKNIELKNNSISLEYKTDIDNRYEKLAFDIDTLEIKETSILICLVVAWAITGVLACIVCP